MRVFIFQHIMTTYNQLPFYVKLGFKFLVIFFICFFINASQNILIPFAFACLLAVLLLPLVNFFEIQKFTKIPSIAISMIFATGFIAGIIYFLSSQISSFMQDIPSIKAHLNEHFISLQNWVREKFHVSFEQQNEY